MPDFTFNGPGGRTFTITGPEGSTREDAIRKFRDIQENQPGLLSGASRAGIDWAGLGERIASWPGRIASSIGEGLKAGPELMGEMARGEVNIDTPEGMKAAVPKAFAAATAFSPLAPSSAAIRTATKAVIPTGEQLEKSAKAGYEALANSGTLIDADAVSDVNNAIKQALEGGNWYSNINAPQTFRMLDKMKRPKTAAEMEKERAALKAQGFEDDEIDINPYKNATIGEIRKAREGLKQAGVDDEDKAAAAFAGRLLDDYFSEIPTHHVISGDPARDAALMRSAGSDYRGASRSEALVGKKLKEPSVLKRAELQAGSAGTGMNFINNLRQKIKSVITSKTDRARYSEEELQALDDIVEGSTLQNAIRYASKLAPAGIVGAGGLKFLGGADPSSAILLAAVGFGAHWGGNAITKRALEKVAEDIRAKSSLARTMPPQQTLAPAPGAAAMSGAAPLASGALAPASDDDALTAGP